MGRTDLDGTVGAVGKPNFGSHFRVFVEDDGSKRLVGTSFDEDLRQGKLTFFEYNERMELLYRTTAELPVIIYMAALLPTWNHPKSNSCQDEVRKVIESALMCAALLSKGSRMSSDAAHIAVVSPTVLSPGRGLWVLPRHCNDRELLHRAGESHQHGLQHAAAALHDGARLPGGVPQV